MSGEENLRKSIQNLGRDVVSHVYLDVRGFVQSLENDQYIIVSAEVSKWSAPVIGSLESDFGTCCVTVMTSKQIRICEFDLFSEQDKEVLQKFVLDSEKKLEDDGPDSFQQFIHPEENCG
jgi:hypothetical protein